ncbi:MAG: hypothetical protein VB859_01215 [Planctomycetaceae bacterium]
MSITPRIPRHKPPRRGRVGRFLGGITLFVAIIVPLSSARGQSTKSTAKTKQLAREIQQLVVELGNNRRATRERAQTKLLSLGPRILDHLPPPSSLKNVATRAAVRRIRRSLEQTQAIRSAEASRVTLEGTFPLEKIVEAISRQSGNPLKLVAVPDALRSRSFPVRFDKQTYWDVLDRLAARTGLISRPGTIALTPGPTPDPVGSIARPGPFRVVATSRTPRKIPGSDQLLIPLRLAWTAEPRLRPLYLVCRPADFRARGHFRDGSSRPLAPRSPDATLELPLGSDDPRLQLRLDFQSAATAPLEEIALVGRANVWLAAGTQAFRFPRPSQSSKSASRRAGVAVVLQSAKFLPIENDRFNAVVQIQVNYESGGPAFESHRTGLLYNRAYLVNTAKQRVKFSRLETPRLGDGTAQITYHFKELDGRPADWDFVFEAATLIIKVPVPLSFPRWKIRPPTP